MAHLAARKPLYLFTLLDIVNHYCAVQIGMVLDEATDFRRKLKAAKKSSGGGSLLDRTQRMKLRALVRTAANCCDASGFLDAAKRLRRSEDAPSTSSEGDDLDVSTAIGTLTLVQDSIREEMSKRHFLVVALDRVAYLEDAPKEFPFKGPPQYREFWGAGNNSTFPKAVEDIKAAGNCLAAECPTAAVFHAMRVAEHGLRVIARRLRVSLTHKGKPEAIEFATWDKVLTGIKNRLTAISQQPHNAKRQRQITNYSELADRCTYMKDLYRNDVMHTRASFNRFDAAGILQHVREWMQSIEKCR